jgi:uncharacterized protein with HEPN domain
MVKDDLVYIEQIIDCISKIKKYASGLTFTEFKADELIQDAIIRNIEILGEASKRVSLHTKQNYADIPWKEISGMRDKLMHDYLGVDIKVVWKTIKVDIPLLKKLVLEIRG